jgi:hypothetical protein
LLLLDDSLLVPRSSQKNPVSEFSNNVRFTLESGHRSALPGAVLLREGGANILGDPNRQGSG